MDARQHAHLFRQLVAKCGGVDEIVRANACRLKASRLYELQDVEAGGLATADVIADLEAYCGEPVYSRAMAEARPSRPDAAGLLDEACDIAEGGAALQKTVRALLRGGPLSPRARGALEVLADELAEELRAFKAAADDHLATTRRPAP